MTDHFTSGDVIPNGFSHEEPVFPHRAGNSRFLTAKAVRNDMKGVNAIGTSELVSFDRGSP